MALRGSPVYRGAEPGARCLCKDVNGNNEKVLSYGKGLYLKDHAASYPLA